MTKKDSFNKFDAFDLVTLDAFDNVELPIEDKVIFSDQMRALIKEELQKEIAKIPIGKIISRILEKEFQKQKDSFLKLSKLMTEKNSERLDEVKGSIEEVKKENEAFKKKTQDKYTDFLNKYFSIGQEKLYLGGPVAIRIQEEDGSDLGYPTSLKFSNGSITVNSDGSYSIAGGGITEAEADLRYLKLIGGVLTGDLDLQQNSLILQASDLTRWRVTINTDGSLQTTLIPPTTDAEPMGPPPFLWITYP